MGSPPPVRAASRSASPPPPPIGSPPGMPPPIGSPPPPPPPSGGEEGSSSSLGGFPSEPPSDSDSSSSSASFELSPWRYAATLSAAMYAAQMVSCRSSTTWAASACLSCLAHLAFRLVVAGALATTARAGISAAGAACACLLFDRRAAHRLARVLGLLLDGVVRLDPRWPRERRCQRSRQS